MMTMLKLAMNNYSKKRIRVKTRATMKSRQRATSKKIRSLGMMMEFKKIPVNNYWSNRTTLPLVNYPNKIIVRKQSIETKTKLIINKILLSRMPKLTLKMTLLISRQWIEVLSKSQLLKL